jgi:hypothetical protein
MIGIALHVYYLRLHVLGFIADGVNDHSATHRAVRTRAASFRGARDLKSLRLRISRSEIKSEDGGCNASDGADLYKIAASGRTHTDLRFKPGTSETRWTARIFFLRSGACQVSTMPAILSREDGLASSTAEKSVTILFLVSRA